MAWIAALASAVMGAAGSAKASSNAKKSALAGSLAGTQQDDKRYTPTTATTEKPPATGADLSKAYTATPPMPQPAQRLQDVMGKVDPLQPPPLPEGRRLQDVTGKVNSLSQTDLSSTQPLGAQTQNPALGTQPQNSAQAGLTTGQETNATETPNTGGDVDYGQLAGLAMQAVQTLKPNLQGGGIPQAGTAVYQPTAGMAQQRLRDLLASRRQY